MRAVRILLQVKGHDLVGPLGTEFRWSTIVLSKMHMSENRYSVGVKCQLFNVN